jgi:hypothetical protein
MFRTEFVDQNEANIHKSCSQYGSLRGYYDVRIFPNCGRSRTSYPQHTSCEKIKFPCKETVFLNSLVLTGI